MIAYNMIIGQLLSLYAIKSAVIIIARNKAGNKSYLLEKALTILYCNAYNMGAIKAMTKTVSYDGNQ